MLWEGELCNEVVPYINITSLSPEKSHSEHHYIDESFGVIVPSNLGTALNSGPLDRTRNRSAIFKLVGFLAPASSVWSLQTNDRIDPLESFTSSSQLTSMTTPTSPAYPDDRSDIFQPLFIVSKNCIEQNFAWLVTRVFLAAQGGSFGNFRMM